MTAPEDPAPFPAPTDVPVEDDIDPDQPTDELDESREPGSPGVTGEHPNRFSDSFGPLDETPDGTTPSDTTSSSRDSLPPGSGSD